MKIAIVTGGDENYVPLMRELIHSLTRFRQSQAWDICVLDAGMTSASVDAFLHEGRKICAPEWPEAIPKQKHQDMTYLKACVCRPFIRDLFPGYGLYVWLDADTWVQDISAIELFIDSAKNGDRIAVTNGADRAYGKPVRISWLGNWPMKVKNFYSSNGYAAFGRGFAKAMAGNYVLSAGCFALASQAPHWQRWQELVIEAASKGKLFPAEQLALGKLVYLEGYQAELLPAYTHWLCVCKPMWDEEKQLFVEPCAPHHPLGVLHLSGVDHLRADRTMTTELKTVQGGHVDKNYRYPGLDGGQLSIAVPVRV